MSEKPGPLPRIQKLAPYEPGLSIDEIASKYGIGQIIKLASNENPLGVSPLVQETIRRYAPYAFRYPQGGNPALLKALAAWHNVDESRLVVGNGSDEIIDLLIRILADPGQHNVVCFSPCFSLYPLQAQINGVETRRHPLKPDFQFDFSGLIDQADINTRLVFITTPDNPSGLCPAKDEILAFASDLAKKSPQALLVIDEAYIDFTPDEKTFSLLANGTLPENTAFLRTFSKSFGLAGLRIGYGVLPPDIAAAFRAARLPFSVNILAEKAALAALSDHAFRERTLAVTQEGREQIKTGLEELGCQVIPGIANFLMFKMPAGAPDGIFNLLLEKGLIIRKLASYGLPDYYRVSIGAKKENEIFLKTLASILQKRLQNE